MTETQPASARHAWLAEPLPRECAAAIDRFARLEDVRHIAIMPDVHGGSEGSGLGAGLALAAARLLIPAAVGADIGCGMSTCRLGISADAISDEQVALNILTAIKRAVPVICHSRRSPPALPLELASSPLSTDSLRSAVGRDGTLQFGSLGRGNHFLELQRDEENELWLLVHSGSRAMGQLVTQAHLSRATKQSGIAVLDAETDAGRAYAADVAWATEYARLSRVAMLRSAAKAIGSMLNAAITPGPIWGTAHNTLAREEHRGEQVWVHRKGAAPAHAGLSNVIPGSMAAETFHVEGRGHPDSLSSSSHGAGRACSRTEATKRNSTKDLSRQLRDVYFDAEQLPRLRDEAPAAYRDIRAVMRAQSDLVRITRRLTPVLTFKGV
ncbi:MAG: RtcB family protein [Phycisphaerales bacterium]